MLQAICEHIHNRFIRKPHTGEYTISGGMISPLDFLAEGQRFWLVGSVLNDGLYTYHAVGCTNDDDTEDAGFEDETFTGTICAAAIPRQLASLSAEIAAWVEKYGVAMNSPYQSESFGGYSYTKQQASKSFGKNPTMSWEAIFASRLNTWRKLC